MKAVLLYEYGGVDRLHYEDAPIRSPEPDEVLVKMISTSINPVDYKIRSGVMKGIMDLAFPFILGRDVAGEVTAIGGDVTKFDIGDRVMGLVNQSYAEYVTEKADVLTLVPEGMDMNDAGVLPLVLLTGAQLIEKGVKPARGEVILITGAAGSVGRTAVFIARQAGATVIAGVREAQKSEAQMLGADSVVALDIDAEIASLPELAAIADTVNGETLAKLLPKLKKTGRMATVLGKSPAAEKAGVAVTEVWSEPDAERLSKLAMDVLQGRLTIPIAERFALRDIRKAHEAAENDPIGKIALFP